VLERIRERFQACNLELHPGKTRIVYCKDINRTEEYPDIQFTFLGYTNLEAAPLNANPPARRRNH